MTDDEFENRFRSRLKPSADLRSRVIGAVAIELAASQQVAISKRPDRFYWIAVAAALLVLSVSMISTSRDEFAVFPTHDSNQIGPEIRAIQQLEQQGILR